LALVVFGQLLEEEFFLDIQSQILLKSDLRSRDLGLLNCKVGTLLGLSSFPTRIKLVFNTFQLLKFSGGRLP